MFRIKLKRLHLQVGGIKGPAEVTLTTEDGKTRKITGYLPGTHPDGYEFEMAGGGPKKTLQVQHSQLASCSFEVLTYREDSVLSPDHLARLEDLIGTTEALPK